MRIVLPKKKKVNSRRKGSTGEREWAEFLRSYGIEARRGQQFKGTKDSPDVESELEEIHWEVKRVEKLNISNALAQAEEERGEDQVAIVAHRKNDEDWMVTMFAGDFLESFLVGKEVDTEEGEE